MVGGCRESASLGLPVQRAPFRNLLQDLTENMQERPF
jgi:hypothetical protein